MPQPQVNAPQGDRAAFIAKDYDLAATLASGQSFRWKPVDGAWHGVIRDRWVRLVPNGEAIEAQLAAPAPDWSWLRNYLQLDVDLGAVLGTFPDDEPMRRAVKACRGLRLLRQDPWECLASFILSSTKQIVQIQQIVGLLCQRFGTEIPSLESVPVFSFPAPARLAAASESELRACKMGFRAPYLRETAMAVAAGAVKLDAIRDLEAGAARAELVKLPGVGRKIADCVLLFAYGFPQAFPVDVWVMKALCRLYFPRRRPSAKRLLRFSETHFGPNSGYAQQYLFHYMRTIYEEPGSTVHSR